MEDSIIMEDTPIYYTNGNTSLKLKRVISGGQTGVDRAALDAAMDSGLEVGGWCPRGRKALDGVIPARYPLTETRGKSYQTRTKWNVRDSDATLILCLGEPSGGTALTIKHCEKLGKPFYVHKLNSEYGTYVGSVGSWLSFKNIQVLNVAGPREGRYFPVYDQAHGFLSSLFRQLLGDDQNVYEPKNYYQFEPLVTRSPVMFVFDSADTEGDPLPDDVINPFAVGGEKIGIKYGKTLENAIRDGIETHSASMGSQRAGSIGIYKAYKNQLFRNESIPVRYSLELKQEASNEENYATLAHELGHLYCGHLGTPYSKWWTSRTGMTLQIREIEAESVAHLVCSRFGLKNLSEKYLAGYVDPDADMPPISLECIMKAAGLIERMAKISLPLRKPPPKPQKA